MDANVTNVAGEAQSFVERMKDFFNVEKFMESFDFSAPHLIKMGSYATVGFLLGFFLKKYGRALIITLLVFAALLYALSYISVITVHWDHARTVIGLSATDSVDSVLQDVWGCIQKQALLVVCGLVGFIAGYKVA